MFARVCMYTCIHVYMNVHVHKSTVECARGSVGADFVDQVCIFICEYIYMCMCMYIYI